MSGNDFFWYCIRTAPKQESKVAILLQREVGVEVLSPKIRFRRGRMGHAIWWTEALFPGYVFARFEYLQQHRQVRALAGVSTIVEFGKTPAVISDEVLMQLRKTIGEDDTLVINAATTPASEVTIVSGPLRGLRLLVTRVMPSRERVAVLLEILGAEREVELDARTAVPVNPRASSGSGHLGL